MIGKQFKFNKLVKFITMHRNIVVEERTVDPGLINAITPYYKSYLLLPSPTNSPAVLLPGRELQTRLYHSPPLADHLLLYPI